MVDRAAPLSIRRQCELLQVSRSGVYYEPEPTSDDELALMRRIDELHLKFPFYGSRKITVTLKAEGHAVNRKRIQRLMRQMGLEALVPKPTTSRPGHECPAYETVKHARCELLCRSSPRSDGTIRRAGGL
jgi:putative transposase